MENVTLVAKRTFSDNVNGPVSEGATFSVNDKRGKELIEAGLARKQTKAEAGEEEAAAAGTSKA